MYMHMPCLCSVASVTTKVSGKFFPLIFILVDGPKLVLLHVAGSVHVHVCVIQAAANFGYFGCVFLRSPWIRLQYTIASRTRMHTCTLYTNEWPVNCIMVISNQGANTQLESSSCFFSI